VTGVEESDLAYLKVLPQYEERSLSTQVSKAACGKIYQAH